MKLKAILACGTAAALFVAGNAGAATINLVDLGITDARAARDFNIAAQFWGKMFTNNVTVNIGVGFSHLDDNILGSTQSTKDVVDISAWEAGVVATRSNSTIDQTAVLPSFNEDGGVSMIVNGTNAGGTTSTAVADQFYATNSTGANYVLALNTAVEKAIGGTVTYDPDENPLGLDGSVQFSSDYASDFDFDPTDGIGATQIDFLAVAIHEIGHALGFVSGVDLYDAYGTPSGPGKNILDINNYAVLSALDMFRYSTDPNGKAPGDGPVLDQTVGTASYFSIDGGQTQMFGNSLFATGAFNGDGSQASHWKDSPTCNGYAQLGVMDPNVCGGQLGVVKGLDLAAFDAIGWNLSTTATAGYTHSTAQIFAENVPEPASWALMLSGFGLIGATMRRKRIAVSFG